MSKRKYTHIKTIEAQIISMREAGMTRQEIADELGLSKSQIKDWVRRYHRRKELLKKGIVPNARGRPRKDGQSPKQDIQKEVVIDIFLADRLDTLIFKNDAIANNDS